MILANAELVLPDRVMRGAIHVEGGMIAGITEGDAVPRGAVDCGGDLLIPGLIELHTDNLERHIQPRPGVDWPHETAILAHDGELASTGITTVFDALRVGSIYGAGKGYAPYALALAQEINALSARQATRISHFIHLRAEICSETLIEEMEAFGPDHRVRLVSLMDHTPGQRQFRDIAKLEEYEKGKHGMSDAQFHAHIEKLLTLRAGIGDRHEAEAVRIAGELGATLASHDDTTAAQVATSAAHGVRLAEFPTTVEAAATSRDAGIRVIMGAPNLIRGGSHSGNVAAVVSHDVWSFDMSRVLIPRGSRLFGRYDSEVDAGQRRVLIAWDRIVTTDGQSVELAAYGTDRIGRSGLPGKVRNHFLQRFGTAALISVIGAVPAIAAARYEGDEVASDTAESVGNDLGEAVNDVMADYLRIPPTISVNQGAVVMVRVDADIEFY